MLAESEFNWSYFDAHRQLACEELSYDEDKARLRFGRGLARQEVAVFSSHYGVWKQFLARGAGEYLLVMEDDLILDTDFPLQEFVAFCASAGLPGAG